jgi:GT2 family glycosyltransferase
MGIRKHVLDEVGGWDENMGWGHEEKELAERIQERCGIYYNPEMVVDHVYAESLRDYWNKMYHLEKGTPYFLQKQGYTKRDILVRTLSRLVNPRYHLRRSGKLTLAKSGGTIAGSAGRLVGLVETQYATSRNEPTRTKSQSEG